MTTKRARIILALAGLQASFVNALGLGDITLHSALDQPLSAEIRLRGVGDLNGNQIFVMLASGNDFERAGVERSYFLSEIKFDVEIGADGNGIVHLSTQRPIKEPYLDFIIEARWPTGRVLREYTVLLDLPTIEPAPEPAPAPRAAPRARSAASASSGGGNWSGGDNYEVSSGDTLWSIANRVRPQGVSVQRMMVALHDANPEAFIRGNINLLRSGKVLRIPPSTELDALSEDQAHTTVSEHNREWREGEAAAAPAQAPAPEPAAPPVSAAATGGTDEAYLKLAGDGAGSSAVSGTGAVAGGDTAGTAAASPQEELSSVKENLSAAELTNAELESRVKALEQQVKDYQKLVELKNDAAATAQQNAGATPKPAPAPAPKPAEKGMLDSLLGNVWAMVGALVVLVGGTVGFLVSRRRRTQELPAPRYAAATRKPEPEPVAAPAYVPEPVAAPVAPVATAPVAPEPAVVPAPATAAAPEPEPEIHDPVSEADIYLAYGRHERAMELLRGVLDKDPDNQDARLKLMEICADQDDRAGFVREYGVLRATGATALLVAAEDLVAGSSRDFWLDEFRIPLGQAAAAPQEAREDEDLALAVADADTSLELDHGDFSLDLDATAPDAGVAEDTLDLDQALGEFELGDLDTTAGDDAAGTLEPDAAAAGLGDLELGDLSAGDDASADLSLDLAPEPEASLPTVEAEADAAADADLDLLAGTDEIETKLELARAYIDMGDADGARDILEEVLADGSHEQRDQAAELLDQLRAG